MTATAANPRCRPLAHERHAPARRPGRACGETTASRPPPCRPGFPTPVLRRPRSGSRGCLVLRASVTGRLARLCEMGLAETAAGLWSVILPGLAGGKSIDRARWVLLAAEACAASHEGGGTVSRLADTVERDALDTPAGPARRFLRAAAGLAQAAIDGWRQDRGALEIRRHLPSLRRIRSWHRSASAHSSR